ncbi:MAG: hypothetical protein HPY83_18780 [Anaerolineae bacterium]|nr:hypothetical protein [Anaerolineae bacterium]
MSYVREALRQTLDQVSVIDPHCHLRPHKPAADNLADIVLYHHVWIELVSSGMPQQEVSRAGLPHELADPEMPPLERVRLSLPYLPRVESTTSGLLLRWLLRDLYGIPALSEDNLEQAAALAQVHGHDPAWQEQVLRTRCRIETSITVEHGGAPYSAAVALGTEGLPVNLRDGKRSPRQVVESLDELLGREVRNAEDYRELLATLIGRAVQRGSKFVGAWPLPYLATESAAPAEATRSLDKARERDHLTAAELGAFATFGLETAFEELARTSIRTFQLIVGAEVLPPHRALTHWSPTFAGALARLAGAHEDVHLNLSTASDLFTQDLGILAKHFPNVSVAGYWWHTFYPYYIRKSLETRLDMVPANKIVGFFSDAYHAEWCYPKLKLVKQIVEDVLADRVERGWYGLDLALRLVERLFHQNAREIYDL